jgi:alginate O-acetyltransferase complex protein AlgI
VTLGWVFFRSESLKDSFNYLKNIFSKSFFTKPEILPKITIIFILIFILIEWFGKNDKYVFSKIIYLKKRYRWIIYLILCFLIFILSSDKTEFIYFQF